MVDWVTLSGASLVEILSDDSSPARREVEAARDAILRAAGPDADRFSDPHFIEGDLLPSLFDTFVSWEPHTMPETDRAGVYSRFAQSVSRYAAQLEEAGYFRHASPNRDFMETSYARVVARSARYSSMPPDQPSGEGIVIVTNPPPSSVRRGDSRKSRMWFVRSAIEVIETFGRLSDSAIGCTASQAYGEVLRGEVERLDRGDVSDEEFLGHLLQDDTRVHLRNFTYNFEDWFFGIIDRVRELQKSGKAAMEGKSVTFNEEIGAEIRRQFDSVYEWMELSRVIAMRLEEMLKMDGGAPFREAWRAYMLNAPMLAHDFAGPVTNIQTAALTIERVIRGRDTAITVENLNEIIRSFDASSTAALIKMIENMIESSADDANIRLATGRMDDVRIPGQYRSPLFRIVREFGRNAIKHPDGAKDDKYIMFSSTAGNGHHVIEVEDNGLGIENVERAMLEWGYREHPDRNEGTGFGLPHKVRLADELGWRIEIESELGKFTKARVVVDDSGWDGSPSDPDGRDEGDGTFDSGHDVSSAGDASSAAASAMMVDAIQVADFVAGGALMLGYAIA